LEQTDRFADAGRAFEDGSNAARGEYPYFCARLLLAAGRAYVAAADTTAALRVLERLTTEFSEMSAAQEARLRMAELGKLET
jgi:HAMP domain-containing protein